MKMVTILLSAMVSHPFFPGHGKHRLRPVLLRLLCQQLQPGFCEELLQGGVGAAQRAIAIIHPPRSTGQRTSESITYTYKDLGKMTKEANDDAIVWRYVKERHGIRCTQSSFYYLVFTCTNLPRALDLQTAQGTLRCCFSTNSSP